MPDGILSIVLGLNAGSEDVVFIENLFHVGVEFLFVLIHVWVNNEGFEAPLWEAAGERAAVLGEEFVEVAQEL